MNKKTLVNYYQKILPNLSDLEDLNKKIGLYPLFNQVMFIDCLVELMVEKREKLKQ